MQRDYRIYLEDILQAIDKIARFTQKINFSSFLEDEKTFDAVVRNLEIIGEATKKVPEKLRAQYPTVEWKKLSGLRDVLAHDYWGIDAEIVWDIAQNKLAELKKEIRRVLENIS